MGGKKKKDEKRLSGDVKRSVAAIFLFVAALIAVLGFFDAAALLGRWFNTALGSAFGWGKWLSPVLFVLSGIVLLRRKEKTFFYVGNVLGFLLAFVSVLGLFHIFFDPERMKQVALAGSGGGYVGYLTALFLHKFTGLIAGVIILAAALVTSVLISFNLSVLPVWSGLKERFGEMREKLSRRQKRREDDEEENEDYSEDEELAEDFDEEEYDEDEDTESADDYEDYPEDEEPKNDLERDENLAANIKEITFDDELRARRKKEKEEIENEKLSVAEDPEEPEETSGEEEPARRHVAARRPKGKWKIPPISLVEGGTGRSDGGDVKDRQKIIVETFANFGITLEPAEVVVGPTVTQYSFRPPAGVKLSRITALSSDVALALAASSIRIEAPIPGKSLIGIEVPNVDTAPVRMREALRLREFGYKKPGLRLALGKDVSGKYVVADLGKMPHALVAGSTGAGKSVAVNTMILSLLYQNTPADLRLILVDPKRVELSLYNGIPHLLSDVIVEGGKVLNALKWAIGEMERRYMVLQTVGSRDIASYNAKVAAGELDETEHTKLPNIVIIIDELADLMASHGKEIEGAIVRLAQKSRAVGIHLIVSTQRPSVEVITGLIKTNIPTRIALRVPTQIDSRTILDTPGAEKLVGRGDMLLLSPQHQHPKRIQGIFVSEDEVKRVVKFLSVQEWPDEVEEGLEEAIDSEQTAGLARSLDFAEEANDSESDDPLYMEAKNLVISAGKASTSYLQRRLRIGYSRAARLIDELEENGVISPAEGSKPRVVLIGRSDEEEVSEDDVPMVK